MTHKKLQIVPRQSPRANPPKTEVQTLIQQTQEIVGKNPEKAAQILSSWIKKGAKKAA